MLLAGQVLAALDKFGVSGDTVRVVDHDVRFGVSTDEGDGDEWPAIRAQVLDADILVISTPIWMGQPSSVCKMVLERLDAELGEADDNGHYPTTGKVACVAVVGNEDGAHHVVAECLQALNDVGFSVAPTPAPTGSARPCRGPTTSTSTRHPRRRPARPTRWRRTPSTLRGSSRATGTRPPPEAGTAARSSEVE